MKKLIAQAKALWASLPAKVQTTAVAFVTVAGTTLAKEVQGYLFGTLSFSVSSLRHDVGAALVAGYIAARAFNMLPNRAAAEVTTVVPK